MARLTTLLISLGVLPTVAYAQAEAETPPLPMSSNASPVPPPQSRAALMPLYATFVGLQAIDFETTTKAIRSGAGREANPAMQAIVGSPVVSAAVKVAATASIIVACERLRKRHHAVAATVLMIGLNSAYAVVAAHNLAIARGAP